VKQLVLDVGNTETAVGVMAEGSSLQAHWRLSTQTPRTPDEFRHLLRGLLRDAGYGPDALHRAVVASVVPSVGNALLPALDDLVGKGGVVVVSSDEGLPIRLDVDEPRTVGADRIVNTLAALERYGRDTIAVDLGTATTFDCITADGVFLGGVIAPGVSSGLEWLGRRTAKLPRVEFSAPEQVIGRNTEACIRSGIFFSVVDAVDGAVRRIKQEWDRPDALVVATGGYATAVGPHAHTVELVEPFLTLYGLALAGDRLAAL
jgi:type III pantothenate kinase